MKVNFIVLLCLLMSQTGCKNSRNETSLTTERDSLLMLIDEREIYMDEFITTFNEVESNLDSVSVKQHQILMRTGDGMQASKARINSEIRAINTLMDQNTRKLTVLYGKFKFSEIKNAQLEKTILILNNQLNSKYAELAELSKKLKKLHINNEFMEMSIELLIVQNLEQAQVIEEKTDELRSAYYIVANSSDLQHWELIDKQGGFMGMGKTSKLNSKLDINMFTKIDYLQVTSIPVNGRAIKIITTHPGGSFSLDQTGKTVNSILINDPEKFWSVSKYLVVAR